MRPKIRQPHREPERACQRQQARAVEAREVIEDRVRDRRELREICHPHRPTRGKGPESLVLPTGVRVALVGDVQLTVPQATGDATVAKERADDDLQLHGVRREPSECGVRALQHVVSYRSSLERAPIVTAWTSHRAAARRRRRTAAKAPTRSGM